MTPAEFRRLALSLPHAVEREHMRHPDFRVAGRIFATLGYPDETWAMVKLFPDQQAAFVAADPAVFVPVRGAWGRQGCTNVALKAAHTRANREKVKEALETAWTRCAQKRPASRERS